MAQLAVIVMCRSEAAAARCYAQSGVLGHKIIDDTKCRAAFRTAIEMLSLCTSMPIYLLLLVIKGCSCRDGLWSAPKPYSKRGTLLYCV
jgi:hypothetical protein